eukprot:NODE_221_length_13987_cov_0.244888.p10 type:complete len:100 gc:universal NODE_221_length_13987_cov_0.244888:11644-11943(+)
MMKDLPRNQKRELQSLRHYTFKKRLSHKCKMYNQKLFIVNEAYSTIECFICNHQSKESVHSRRFKCISCGHEDHRDINPGKNMLKWYLPKLSTLKKCIL